MIEVPRPVGHRHLCGVIGRVDSATLERLRRCMPGAATVVHRSAHATFLADRQLESWTAPRTGGSLWQPLVPGPAPTGWEDASEARMAAGIVTTEDGRVLLHTDALGLHELFVRSVGDATYVSTTIDSLVRCVPGPVRPDWTAWASTLAIGAPVDERTPFREVRRLAAASACVVDVDGTVRTVRFAPRLLAVEPASVASDPRAFVRLLADALPRVRFPAARHLTLSGGWDSRLLAAVAARRGRRRTTAWTTSTDDGVDRDLVLAPPVARALGLRHRSVVPSSDGWAEQRSVTLERTDYQTWMHTWMLPLARKLHSERGHLVDGLAGDVLLRSRFLDRDATPSARDDPDGQRWNRFTGGRLLNLQVLDGDAAHWMTDASRASFERSTRHLDGHHDAARLGLLLTRTARVISLSPLRLFGPERPVVLPFVRPAVLAAALSVPIHEKVDGSFYRRVLLAADEAVGRLPSTNDPPPSPVTPGPRRQASVAAVGHLTAVLRGAPDLHRLLGPQTRAALRDLDAAVALTRTSVGHAVLQWASALAEWRTAYADQLDWDGPP